MSATQTHVGIETRVTVEEAEALERNLPMFATMIRKRVCFARGGESRTEPLLTGIAKLVAEIKQRNEPFDVDAANTRALQTLGAFMTAVKGAAR
jgi:hypothetical protein